MSLIKNIINTIFSKKSKTINNQKNLQEMKKQLSKTNQEVNPFEFPTKEKKSKPVIKKPTKFHQVRLHLLNKGTINSWTAIELYGATRLSDIIFRLRGRGMNITSIPCSALDRNSNVCNYTTYKLEN